MRRAVTLLELLVVIAVIGVLIAIGLPILRTVQQSARTAACLANIREVGRAASAYAGEHAGQMPYLAERKHLNNAFNIGAGPEGYFEQLWMWPHVLRGYLGEGLRPAACYCPWHPGLGAQTDRSLATGQAHQFPDGVAHPSRYHYNSAFYSGPGLWRRPDPIVDASQLRPVQQSSTAHPSVKIVFYCALEYHRFDYDDRVRQPPSWHLSHPTNIVFADGAASGKYMQDALVWDDPLANPFLGDGRNGTILLNTLDGYLGRDF